MKIKKINYCIIILLAVFIGSAVNALAQMPTPTPTLVPTIQGEYLTYRVGLQEMILEGFRKHGLILGIGFGIMMIVGGSSAFTLKHIISEQCNRAVAIPVGARGSIKSCGNGKKIK